MATSVSRPAEQTGQRGRPEGYRLWVGASFYGRAETALVSVMPYLAREATRHADSAWR
jgi:hypothetical protein